MKEKLEEHVCDALEDTTVASSTPGIVWRTAREFASGIYRSFESLESLLSVLTPKRWELLKYVHSHQVRSVRALSVQLKRDYRRVHDDVEALAIAGLLERSGRAVRADYDGIDSTFRFDHSHQ